MKLKTVPARFDTLRKAYELESEEIALLDFKKGDEVIPAELFEQPGTLRFFFIKKHEPGESGWKDGGYTCRDSTGGLRSFHLDALIKKGVMLDVTVEIPTQRKRGRPRLNVEKPKTDKPKGKRGRPRKNPEEKATKKVYTSTGGKRGRPRLNPDAPRIKQEYVPTGRKRGRPKKDETKA